MKIAEKIKSLVHKESIPAKAWRPKYNERQPISREGKSTSSLEGLTLDGQFKIGELLGYGAWGDVYLVNALDSEEQFALKVLNPTALAREQLVHRAQTLEKAVRNEDFLHPAKNVVPRQRINFQGLAAYLMPVYQGTLADEISTSYGSRLFYNNGLPKERIDQILLQVASALEEIHETNRAYGDLKPNNLFVDSKKRVLISDLGTSSVDGTGRSVSPRDNVGCAYTRSKDCFKEGSHISKNSDIFAFGSLAYRLFTGEYLFEQELDEDPDFLSNASESELNKLIKSKMKRIPRAYRELLTSCVSESEYSPYDGERLREKVADVIDNAKARTIIKKSIGKWTKILVPTAVLGAVIYNATMHEPQELSLPVVGVNGFIELNSEKNEPVKFHAEKTIKLPDPSRGLVWDWGFGNRIAKYATENRSVAFLLTAYDQTIKASESPDSEWIRADAEREMNAHYFSKAQLDTWRACTPESLRNPLNRSPGANFWHKVVATSLEYAMTQAKRPDGTIDLEDTLTISLVGLDKVNEARRAANSFEFANYCEAKDSEGKYIINKKSQRFLKQWLSQVDYTNNPRKYDKY